MWRNEKDGCFSFQKRRLSHSHGNLGRRLDIVFLFDLPMSLVLSQIIGETHAVLLKMINKELNDDKRV